MATSTSRRSASRGPDTRYHLIGGKGGVGKTTCAAALALSLSDAGARTLVISTDPAPSLGDVLQRRLGSDPRPVPAGRGDLHAAEIDARVAIRRWLLPRRPILQSIAVQGTWLDESDVSSLLSLSFPGIDEIAALLELLRYGRSGRYDEIVIDTAPTGHTLRMLALPDTMAGIAQVFDHMRAKHRAIVQALRGGWDGDEADAVIAELQNDAGDLRQLLRDAHRLEVAWVTTPEVMAIEETLDALQWLTHAGIPVSRLVLNRLTTRPPEPCSWCQARRIEESAALSQLRSRLGRQESRRSKPAVVCVSGRDTEPIGRRALRSIGRELSAEAAVSSVRRARHRHAPVDAILPVARARAVCDPFHPAVRLVMFGGKGGVGKTTCAAAAAHTVAAAYKKRRILLLSTDPAHSLEDVLISSTAGRSRPSAHHPRNLDVRQLDASHALDSMRRRYAAAIDALFDRIAGGAIEAAHDRSVMHALLDLAPPGLDEIAAVLDVIALLESGAPAGYDTVVMDTAPTGHAVRLLEMPALVHDWVKALMSILLKYQPLAGIGEVGEGLLRLSKGLTRLRSLMVDPERTTFVVVTRPALLPFAETKRLFGTLARLPVKVSAVIVNAVGSGGCRRCRRTASAERRTLTTLRAAARAARVPCVIVAGARLPAPRGWRNLSEWRARWVSAPALSSIS